MKKYSVLMLLSLIVSCASLKYPPVEASMNDYRQYTNSADSISRIIKNKSITGKLSDNKSRDVVISTDVTMFNKLMSAVSNQRDDDVKLFFNKKQNFIKEDKSVLGIYYTNYMNIDTGFVAVNLKKFNFGSINYNMIDAGIELEGKGFFKVSGKYSAIPASASPDVYIYLSEPIAFTLKSNNSGAIVLTPVKKTLMLKTKFQIKMLEWYLPYYQEIPLELKDIVQPLTVPLSFSSVIQLPLPAQKLGKDKIEFGQFEMKLTEPVLSTAYNKLFYSANLSFMKK